jgi:hypothetical protein
LEQEVEIALLRVELVITGMDATPGTVMPQCASDPDCRNAIENSLSTRRQYYAEARRSAETSIKEYKAASPKSMSSQNFIAGREKQLAASDANFRASVDLYISKLRLKRP